MEDETIQVRLLLRCRRRPVKRILGHLPAANRLRAKLRAHAEPWIGDLAWPFPTWSIRSRPFDWEIDSQGRAEPGWLDIERGEQLAQQHDWP